MDCYADLPGDVVLRAEPGEIITQDFRTSWSGYHEETRYMVVEDPDTGARFTISLAWLFQALEELEAEGEVIVPDVLAAEALRDFAPGVRQESRYMNDGHVLVTVEDTDVHAEERREYNRSI